MPVIWGASSPMRCNCNDTCNIFPTSSTCLWANLIPLFPTHSQCVKLSCYKPGDILFTSCDGSSAMQSNNCCRLQKEEESDSNCVGLGYAVFSCESKQYSNAIWIYVSEPTYFTAHYTLQWRHNGHDGTWNHQRHNCLLKCLFRRRSKKTSKLHVSVFVGGIHRWPMNSTHKWPVTHKMSPFNDDIMIWIIMHMVSIFLCFIIIRNCYRLFLSFGINTNEATLESMGKCIPQILL